MATPLVRGRRPITRPRTPSWTVCWMMTAALIDAALRATPRPTVVAAVSQMERE